MAISRLGRFYRKLLVETETNVRGLCPQIYEPLRRDVLHYIFEQTSNVHLHNEECTAALMQCLIKMLNALEVAIHVSLGRTRMVGASREELFRGPRGELSRT